MHRLKATQNRSAAQAGNTEDRCFNSSRTYLY
jgi:hypothetical protein